MMLQVTKAAAMKLMPLDPYTPCKVPYALRTRYLALFHDECVKFCASEEEAIIQVGAQRFRLLSSFILKLSSCGGHRSRHILVERH